jgi:hypothetical protein
MDVENPCSPLIFNVTSGSPSNILRLFKMRPTRARTRDAGHPPLVAKRQPPALLAPARGVGVLVDGSVGTG